MEEVAPFLPTPFPLIGDAGKILLARPLVVLGFPIFSALLPALSALPTVFPAFPAPLPGNFFPALPGLALKLDWDPLERELESLLPRRGTETAEGFNREEEEDDDEEEE